MAQVFKWCPKCKHVLPDVMAGLHIAPPFRECSKCGLKLVDRERNEWKCMRGITKFGHVLQLGVGGLWVGGGGLVAIMLLVKSLEIKFNNSGYLVSFIFLFVVGVAYFGIQLGREIEQSNRRVEDPAYREELMRAGFKIQS